MSEVIKMYISHIRQENNKISEVIAHYAVEVDSYKKTYNFNNRLEQSAFQKLSVQTVIDYLNDSFYFETIIIDNDGYYKEDGEEVVEYNGFIKTKKNGTINDNLLNLPSY